MLAKNKSLEDEFAGLAMQSILLANMTIGDTEKIPNQIAREAYALAKAMMKERQEYDGEKRQLLKESELHVDYPKPPKDRILNEGDEPTPPNKELL